MIYDLFKPVRVVLRANRRTRRRAGRALQAQRSGKSQQTLKESDFMLMVEEGHKEGAVQATEVELIKNVFEFDERRSRKYLPRSPRSVPSMKTTIRAGA